MARCEVCGNDYDMAFEVHAQGQVHTFVSFECAITRMAPVCEHYTNGARNAVDERKKADGSLGQKLVLEVGDDGGQQQQQVHDANRLTCQGVRFIVGPPT